MDKLFKVAVAELGQKEVVGPANNPAIVNYAKEAGFSWINDDETPWCSIFMNWVAMKAGLKRSKKLDARSWMLEGLNVDTAPEPGDVVIFWRDNINSWKGHVAIFYGYSKDGTRVYCLGGNQGNQVSISAYPKDTVLGFRRLIRSDITQVPDKILKRGDTGDDVKMLQNALKAIDINCGTTDGFFGPKTEEAVKKLQSMRTGLAIDGVFDTQTHSLLIEIITQ